MTALTIGMVSFTLAWLSGSSTEVNVTTFEGGVISQYFHCGTGTENDPYVITRPVHIYNMTQLYLELDGFAEENNYFQLGYDLEENGTLEVYSYGDDGKIIEDSYSTSLNMNYYSELDPIGDADNPFGGTFDGSTLTIENVHISGDGYSDIGFFGYISEDAVIKDLYLDNIEIDVTGAVVDQDDAHDENAYVGYIAGHVENANCVTGTYVNNCNITGSSCLIKNDWGYYGYCDNAGTLEDFLGRVGEEEAAWGGSVNMQKMYNRLYAIAGQATANSSYAFEKEMVTRPNGTTFERDKTTGYAYTYRSQTEGSFVFTRYNQANGPRSDYMYISGGTRYSPIRQTTTSKSGYYISYNGHYLGVNGTNIVDHQDGWEFSNNLLSITIDGVKYYLTHNVTLSSTTQETWTKNGNRLYYSGSGWFSSSYYLTYSNGWTTTTSRTNLTWTTTTIETITESSDGADYMDYSGTNVSYFPLNTEADSYAVSGKNTGYVIGGSEDKTTSGTYPDKTGDIRVSKYSTGDISNSYSGGTLTTVYTINANNRTEEINADNYEKYLESKDDFLSMITDGNIYGLHFMSANISQNHLVTADYAKINGEEKYNYEMPSSSIDFNLLERGFINFFAGTYFNNNNSFFSLHHIERDENEHITSIKEIAEIYESSDETKDFIYKYSDNSYTATLTSDYSLAFSTTRIKRQSRAITEDAVYYFEIPVNSGEYALGSVDGGTGCYLMYLDIASNGGIDFNADVDTFGSVEYRSSPDVAENSLVLISYVQQSSESITALTVVYTDDNKRYTITYTGTLESVTVTVLDDEIEVYFNGNMLPQRKQKNILSQQLEGQIVFFNYLK